MFQTFTGSSRRPRQVNLSGRTANPFAAHAASRDSPTALGVQNTVAHAQQERLARQRERDRLNAAKRLQRVYRGYRSRKQSRTVWRKAWDLHQGFTEQAVPIERVKVDKSMSDEAFLSDLPLLLQFVDLRRDQDIQRFDWFVRHMLRRFPSSHHIPGHLQRPSTLLRFQNVALRALYLSSRIPVSTSNEILPLLCLLASTIPKETAENSTQYYETLSSLTNWPKSDQRSCQVDENLLIQAVLCPLHTLTSSTPTAYEGLALNYLTTPNLPQCLPHFEQILSNLNCRILANSLAITLKSSDIFGINQLKNTDARLWLLAYFIHIFRDHGTLEAATLDASGPDFIVVISMLLSSLAEELGARIEIEDDSMDEDAIEIEESETRQQPVAPLPSFVRGEASSLVNQRSISGLLARVDTRPEVDQQSGSEIAREARLLAGYALTLLRVFPRRADEIRMWLYLGSKPSATTQDGAPGVRLPAIKYFWHAAKSTTAYNDISADSRAALKLLKPRGSRFEHESISETSTLLEEEWKIILLFLELYTFLLKVTDDEEFFSGSASSKVIGSGSSWTRESTLVLTDVRDMTIFLKNLAFTLYWNASELSGATEQEYAGGLSGYFSTSEKKTDHTMSDISTKREQTSSSTSGLMGMKLDYVKGIVTGLLRMIYERDSRRRFLPKDHWLMTSRFDMEGFIPAVVLEEENRHRVQEADDEDEQPEDDAGQDLSGQRHVIGTRLAQQTRHLEILRRQQRKASRRKLLEAVTPRLEILQNMPFFIPFETRVQIFREFIHLDQLRRRGGHVDPDNWRMSIMQASALTRAPDGRPIGQDIISRHHARIHRQNLFEDAYNQFYGLGEGLKEPIQITFVDKFDTVEAGIDGGGVTKEFLTSVTKEAFQTSSGLRYFVENDHHLLYPNPAVVDEQKEILREAGLKEGSLEWNEQIRETLRRYEFLGRVIGKCLYEGILVDVAFAGFFLLKWALTGGSGSATKESGYRANLNDLRDMDEALYQGLLQLKNYPGDVEDFALNFTVTDTVSMTGTEGIGDHIRTITRDLKPDGANIPVTNENRLVYISYIARHRLQIQPHLQTSAFLRGLGQMIQPSWLSMFNQSELQVLVGGAASEIDVDDLRQHTTYGGVYVIGDDGEEHPTVKLFWQAMQSMSDANRRKVLKFVTSTPRAPLLGFSQLNPRFSIRDAGDDQERLPSTSTCVNLLKLPRYRDLEVLKEKLLYAVNAGAGFDLS